ncbi:interferon-inducible GTPase-domain-containing protein [Pisolithus thermaeus]|nr:interferon-inducible GTPase-domain-containing protein [Pisolithus thermaeus]
MGQAASTLPTVLYNMYWVAKVIVNIVDSFLESHVRDNPTVVNLDGAKDGRDYARRTARAAAEEAAVAPPETVWLAKQTQAVTAERLRKGVQPVVIPSASELATAKERVQYKDGLFHFAIAGVSGSGKSSLINAFRGLRNGDLGAAPTGVIETTSQIDRYPDPNPRLPFVWYDIPRAGTFAQSDWQYFNSQGLFVFDCIIVLFDNRFTLTDISILTNCRRFQIPTYIVRSKADVHIRNVVADMGYDSDNDDGTRHAQAYNSACEHYIAETRATVQKNLKEAGLPDQRVYVVSHKTMVSTVKDRVLSPKTIHELELVRDLLEEACARRCVPRSDAAEADGGQSLGPVLSPRVY